MTKLKIAAEFLKAHPEALNLNNTQVVQALREAGRGEFSNETVRQARKTVEAEAVPDVNEGDGAEYNDEPADDETVDEANPFAEDEVPVAEQNATREAAESDEPLEPSAEQADREAVDPDFEEYDAPEGQGDEDDEDNETVLEMAEDIQAKVGAGEDVGEAIAEVAKDLKDGKYDNGVMHAEGEEPPQAASPNTDPEPVIITREPVEGRCNHRMERAKDLCGRPLNHPGGHVTVAQMAKKKAFSKKRAKVRYHSDPVYAEKIKKASRDSHKKARDEAKARKEAAEAKAAENETPAAEVEPVAS